MTKMMMSVFIIVLAACLLDGAVGTVTFTNSATTTATVDENAATGTSVLNQSATTDVDGSSINYTISAQTPDNLYAVSDAGLISVASGAVIDAETPGSHTVTVTGVDSTPSTASVVITVTVNDKNDNKPAFSNSLTGTLKASATSGTAVVGTLTASDGDRDSPNKDIAKYALACTDTLEVKDAAVVSVKTGATGPEAGCYSIVITATDSGTDPGALTGTGTISITVGGATCSTSWTPLCAAGSPSLTFSLMAMMLGLLTNLMK